MQCCNGGLFIFVKNKPGVYCDFEGNQMPVEWTDSSEGGGDSGNGGLLVVKKKDGAKKIK